MPYLQSQNGDQIELAENQCAHIGKEDVKGNILTLMLQKQQCALQLQKISEDGQSSPQLVLQVKQLGNHSSMILRGSSNKLFQQQPSFKLLKGQTATLYDQDKLALLPQCPNVYFTFTTTPMARAHHASPNRSKYAKHVAPATSRQDQAGPAGASSINTTLHMNVGGMQGRDEEGGEEGGGRVKRAKVRSGGRQSTGVVSAEGVSKGTVAREQSGGDTSGCGSGVMVLLCGATGAGKSTFSKGLIDHYNSQHSIRSTTNPATPRAPPVPSTSTTPAHDTCLHHKADVEHGTNMDIDHADDAPDQPLEQPANQQHKPLYSIASQSQSAQQSKGGFQEATASNMEVNAQRVTQPCARGDGQQGAREIDDSEEVVWQDGASPSVERMGNDALEAGGLEEEAVRGGDSCAQGCVQWVRINQDSIRKNGKPGTKQQCLAQAKKELRRGNSVLIDRCNDSQAQRQDFVKLAQQLHVPCHAVALMLPKPVLSDRVIKRENHEGGVGGVAGVKVVHFKYAQIMKDPPRAREGFASVLICQTVKQVSAALKVWQQYDIQSRKETNAQIEQQYLEAIGKKCMPSTPGETPTLNASQDSTNQQNKKKQKVLSEMFTVQQSKGQSVAKSSKSQHTPPGKSTEQQGAQPPGQTIKNQAKSGKQISTSSSKARPQMQDPFKFRHFPGNNRLTVLCKDPSAPGDNVVLHVQKDIIVIQDMFPKGRHHLLVIARKQTLRSVYNLSQEHVPLLKAMVEVGKAEATKQCRVKQANKYGFMMGFHRIPSMVQLHLHVISRDLDGKGMKRPHHWQSFNTPYFLTASQAIDQLNEQGHITQDIDECYAYLKNPMTCRWTGEVVKSVQAARRANVAALDQGLGMDSSDVFWVDGSDP